MARKRKPLSAIDAWMTETGTTNRELAILIGRERSTIGRLRRGVTKPDRTTGQRLIEVSGGKLTWDLLMGPR